MTGSDSFLLELLNASQRRLIIPVYQRNYDWTKANCEQLYNDLVDVVQQGKQTHFFGSIVSNALGRDEVELIDGQQRITTVSLILIAIANAIKNGDVVPQDPVLGERIMGEYIIDKYHKTERKVRLKPFRDDCIAFDNLIYKNEEDYVANSNVTLNYRYFYDRIVNEKSVSVDDLFEAINKLQIIDIQLQPKFGDVPQLIFESLNSTGLDLTEADKIRNFVLMGLDSDVQEQYYDNYWNKIEKLSDKELDSFIRNYLTVVTGVIPNIRKIYSAFKLYAKQESSIETILRDMLRYALAYHKIASCSVGSNKANIITKRLNLLDVTVAHPYLMAFLVYAEENQLPMDEIETVLGLIEDTIFRRFICDLPANSLNKIFAVLHKQVIKLKRETDSYSSVLIYILLNRRAAVLFPNDEEFISSFSTKNIYVTRGKSKQYLFERLENGDSKEINDVIGYLENNSLSIEHIMPQTLTPAWREALGENYAAIHEQWLHTIANLTLTGYNSNYSNRPFEEKKTMDHGFIKSGLRLNQYIAQFDQWTETEMKERNEHLMKKALEIWPYPSTNFAPEQKEDEELSLAEDNAVFTGREITYFLFQGEKHVVPNWTEMMWQVVEMLCNINPSILYQEAASADNVWFDTKDRPEDGFRKLAEKLYYCPGHNSTWNKMAILKKLFRLYQLDEDDLTFALAPLKSDDDE